MYLYIFRIERRILLQILRISTLTVLKNHGCYIHVFLEYRGQKDTKIHK